MKLNFCSQILVLCEFKGEKGKISLQIKYDQSRFSWISFSAYKYIFFLKNSLGIHQARQSSYRKCRNRSHFSWHKILPFVKHLFLFFFFPFFIFFLNLLSLFSFISKFYFLGCKFFFGIQYFWILSSIICVTLSAHFDNERKKGYKTKFCCIFFDKIILLILILHRIWFKIIKVNYIFQ